ATGNEDLLARSVVALDYEDGAAASAGNESAHEAGGASPKDDDVVRGQDCLLLRHCGEAAAEETAAGRGEELVEGADGQADDIPVVALDLVDEGGAEALHAVGAGLVEGLAGADVGVDFGGVEGAEGDLRLDAARCQYAGARVEDDDGGVDDVVASAKGS